MVAHSYYGDSISKNMTLTPEGYLICKNVPIGRIGWMDYYGQELPAGFGEEPGKLCKVYRSPEELFSEETMASFEGKPVTNTHPSANLDVNTAPMIERGHAQNVRRDGDFLIADLHIKDAGLISEVQNNLKRETSSGYDCEWHKTGEGKYEQRKIIGNHVAVVPNGRAGPKVAIHDAKPNEKQKTGGNKSMKITQKWLAAIGFKHFAQDAEPEDIAKAMDAMKEDTQDADPEVKKEEAKDAEPENNAKITELESKVDKLISIVEALVKSDKEVHKEVGAEDIMDAMEEEMEKDPATDADPDDDAEKKEDEAAKLLEQAKKEEAKDSDPEVKAAADAALKKFVKDMKPIIMAIPDEKARLEAAKMFSSSVRDARANSGKDGYANIINAVSNNKKSAMDSAAQKKQTIEEATQKSCDAWAAAGQKMKGGK